MKKIVTLLVMSLFMVTTWAQNSDYLLKKDFQAEKKKMADGIDAARKAGNDARKTATKQMAAIDSLSKVVAAGQRELVKTNDSLQRTAAKFNELNSKVEKSSLSAINSLIVSVVVIGILFILILVLVFFLKSKTDKSIETLSEEDTLMRKQLEDELKKSADSIKLTLHENNANIATRIEQADERLRTLASELEELVEGVVKEQALQKSKLDDQLGQLVSKVNTEKTEHKSIHEKIDSEFKGLRTLHIKDVEEIKAKL